MQSSRQHEPQHAEITDERPEWMSKGGGLVAFDQEVARPGEPVAHDRPRQGINRMPQNECPYYNCQSQQGSQRMHHAIAPVTVFRQVEGEKFLVIVKCLL